jgi:hypothetical protein
VTGFGATDEAWNVSHTPDGNFAPGAVYNEDPSLPEVNGHTGAQYTEVLHEDGRVVGYDYHLHSEPIAAAKTDVLSSQFPPDAREAWFAVKGTCAQMLVRSATLARVLGGKGIGDSSGGALGWWSCPHGAAHSLRTWQWE